jgi:uncharacterized protein (TIGR02118 family)
MHKLMLIFRRPMDVETFETRWSHDFVGAAEKMPDIRRVTVSRISGGVSNAGDVYLVHEFYFDDAESMRRAMASGHGQKAGKLLMGFAADIVSICFAEHWEDDCVRS